MTHRCAHRISLVAFIAIVSAPPVALGQSAEPEAPNTTEEPAEAPLPSLDELLGLIEPADGDEASEVSSDDADDAPEDQAAVDLLRELSEEEPRDKLADAARLMGDVAKRIGAGRPDLGLQTQRIQEDILRKLDEAIDSMGQGQGGGGGGGSSQQQQGGQQQQQPNQQGNSGGQSESQGEGNSSGEATPPGLSGVEQNTEIEASAARWGALPERLRGALLQGLGERYSESYRRLTESYYRRLAEEPEGSDR